MVKIVEKSLNNYFSIATIKGINKNKLTQATKKRTYNYITRTTNNNGVSATTGLIKGAKLNPANTFCLNLLQMKVFLQEKPWYAGQFVRLIKPKYNFNKETLLYFQVLINCIAKTFDPQAIKKVDELFNTAKIKVPVTPTGELDTAYMASYVQKIEASYVQKIEAYLAVLGYKSLADCQLNQHDLDMLHAKPQMKKIKVENLLYKVELKWHGDHKFDKLADTSESKTKEFNLPLLNAKHGNNGIMFYGRKDEWDQAKNIIDVVSNGAVATGDVYFQASNISVMWDAYALNTKQAVSAKAKEYIATSLKKAIKLIFGWENKAVWSKVRNIKITLPVTSSGEPDYDFMEDYITAIEKLKVIKIKQYLDQKLSAYREVTK